MDELDLLLEELVLNPTGSEPGLQTSRTGSDDTAAHSYNQQMISLRGKGSGSTNVYSKLPAPVEASPLSPASATRELDSIMQDLLGLGQELSGSNCPETPPPLTQKKSVKKTDQGKDGGGDEKSSSLTTTSPGRKVDAIDNLLGDLNSDMEKMGVHTTAKGHCASCGKSIVGKMISALGEAWHPEHFVCVVCKTELSGFFERDGKAYCEHDYHQLFSPRCAYCKGPILQNILTAMDCSWHPEHFFCAHCGDVFGPEGYQEKDGKPYCIKDFYDLFSPKCSGCGKPVRDNYLTAANGTWHPDCFVCADCLQPFRDGCFLEMDGRPLCSLHYHSRQGTLCGGCEKPIAGRCISAMARKFHPEHFVCAFCLRQLNQGVFKEQDGKPYCNTCHTKLFV
ncbi:leupaxin isoform X1 [Osmerus mordax]|uniref:leupaxin isoform X1 n=1 Tax=Osmerus mordax TaxID=8014 RepID=UPI00350F6671